ncbi:hypothetical protein EJ03DRAFT_378788 [Teratosphaeria nubilosa]|uniref:Uncharacterized protein n=1 Tax=Teratosphaeria nubilosa TaxID=161662 RepID=A0A6G1KUC1_9PEZI|nr:hypothetical protein EJ03DRAFT_378788 [Teratosphaeria nubilosa]
MDRDDEDDISQAPRISLTGLGITEPDEAQQARRVSIKPLLPKPILSNVKKDSPHESTPGSTDPPVSPPSTGRFSGSTQYYDSPHTFDTSYGGAHHLGKQSMSSLHSGQPSIFAKSEAGLLSVRSKSDDWAPEENCQSRKQVKQKMGSWISTLIIALALFSTVFSAIYLIIALRNPRYGRMIHTNGSLTASTAAFLTSLFAKLIELSFVTVLVALIGQALARRAFTLEQARGFEYLGIWTDKIHNGSSPWDNDLSNRPQGFALLTDNTTITAPWIEQDYTNMTNTYEAHGIVINNVSMAMPHPGVIQAAQDPKNNIMQPAELDNLGEYNIKASVPSPVVHVLCSALNTTRLTPFVYELWPEATLLSTEYPDQNAYPDLLTTYPGYLANPFLNHTPLHDIYKWGSTYSATAWPPVFPRLPLNYNTLINDTTDVAYGRDSIYLLGKGGDTDSSGAATHDQNYVFCQMKVSQTPFCSTQYNATSKGGTLEAVCEEEDDEFMYIRSVANATQGASGMAGCTLLQSAPSAPFVPYWDYTSTSTLTPGTHQLFNASIHAH